VFAVRVMRCNIRVSMHAYTQQINTLIISIRG